MREGLSEKRSGLIVASVVIGIALVVCAVIGSNTLLKVKGLGQTLSVTGAAFKIITSDYAVWKGTISVSAPSLAAAYDKIKEDLQKTEAFLQQEGFGPELYDVEAVQIHKDIDFRTKELVGYTLRQTVKVELDDVDRIAHLAKKASSLIDQGVELTSGNPQYLFTKLNDLKVEMIRAATENAKLRAQQLAEATGRSVGPLHSARMGVFQIRAQHSQVVSSRGISDVTSIEKEIVSTVHAKFLME